MRSDSRRCEFGIMIGISKDIRLSIEPSLMLNPSTVGAVWAGIGLGLKYKL